LKRRLIAVIGAALFAMLGMLPLVGAQTAPEITPMPTRSVLLVADAFVRSGPDESFIAVGQLLPGAPLIPLNISEDGDWVLIRYNRGFGWIRRDLALWSVNIDELPPLAANLTPTFIPGPPTATPFFPTNTPSGDFVQVNATSAYLRGGPAVTYLRLGQLFPGATLEPVGRNEDTTWILIRYNEGFAWLRADLGFWVSDLEELPVLRENRLTPSATFTASNTPTRTPTPTDTPTSTNTPSATATHTDTPTSTSTDTATPTLLPTNTETPSATPTDTATATETPTETPSVTPEPSATDTASPESTIAPTDEPTQTVEPTSTNTDVPTATDTSAPTATNTEPPTATNTDVPTATDTATETATSTPTAEPTETASATDTLTPMESAPEPTNESALGVTIVPATDEPSSTPTEEPTETDTPSTEPTNTVTPEPSATDTAAPTETETIEPTVTDTTPPTDTASGPTATVTLAPIPTDTASTSATPEVTSVAAVITVTPAPPTNIPAVRPPQSDDPAPGGISPELIAAGALILLILGYIALYLRGAATASQYVNGFVIHKCPVCREGNLTVEARTERSLGIPNTKHVVRCDNCRSVIRESGGGRWRYAVDRAANPVMYDRLNNREIREDTLKRLLDSPEAGPSRVNPEIVDDEPQA
jgi:hypothetical protein